MKIIYVKGPSTCPWNIHGVCGGIEFPIACDWKTCHLKDAPSPEQRNAVTEAKHGAEQPQLANGAIALMEKIDRFDIEQPNESWHHFMDSILTEWRKGKSESRAIKWMN